MEEAQEMEEQSGERRAREGEGRRSRGGEKQRRRLTAGRSWSRRRGLAAASVKLGGGDGVGEAWRRRRRSLADSLSLQLDWLLQGIQIESILDDKDDDASSLPPSQCPEVEEFRTLLRQQKVLNNLTEQALRKSQPLVISNLTHEKDELLTAQDLMGTSKVEQLCLQVLSMRICPGGGVVDVPVIDSSATAEETNHSNVKSSPAAGSSILDTDLPEIVGVIRSSRDGINKLVELLHQKFPTVTKTQLNRKVREISDFVDNHWQVKKEVLDKLDLTNSPVNHPQKTKTIANLPQKTKATANLSQKTKGIGMYFSKRCLPPEEAINALASSPELRLKSKTVQGSNGVSGAPQVDLFPSTK